MKKSNKEKQIYFKYRRKKSKKDLLSVEKQERQMEEGHIPVMLKEVMQIIRPRSDLKIIDFTFGRGGHSKELLKNGAGVWALDRDLEAVKYGKKLQEQQFEIFHCLFSEARHYLEKHKYFNAAIFDFGLSSTQISSKENGMSFKKDFPLKMTMGKNKMDAYQVVNLNIFFLKSIGRHY